MAPGPGEYDVQRAFDCTVVHGPEYSIDYLSYSTQPRKLYFGKKYLTKAEDVPGPGHYQLAQQEGNKGGKLYCQNRSGVDWVASTNDTPGPGDYHVIHQIQTCAGGIRYSGSTTKAKHQGQGEPDTGPGPGHYDISKNAKVERKRKAKLCRQAEVRRVASWVKSMLSKP